MTYRIHSAFELGWMDGLVGHCAQDCPYDKMTTEWHDWQRARGMATDFRLYATDGEIGGGK